MGRPRKFYVIYDHGRATGIAFGLEAARRVNSGWNGYTSQTAAEEAAAWHNLRREADEAEAASALKDRLAAKGWHY